MSGPMFECVVSGTGNGRADHSTRHSVLTLIELLIIWIVHMSRIAVGNEGERVELLLFIQRPDERCRAG